MINEEKQRKVLALLDRIDISAREIGRIVREPLDKDLQRDVALALISQWGPEEDACEKIMKATGISERAFRDIYQDWIEGELARSVSPARNENEQEKWRDDLNSENGMLADAMDTLKERVAREADEIRKELIASVGAEDVDADVIDNLLLACAPLLIPAIDFGREGFNLGVKIENREIAYNNAIGLAASAVLAAALFQRSETYAKSEEKSMKSIPEMAAGIKDRVKTAWADARREQTEKALSQTVILSAEEYRRLMATQRELQKKVESLEAKNGEEPIDMTVLQYRNREQRNQLTVYEKHISDLETKLRKYEDEEKSAVEDRAELLESFNQGRQALKEEYEERLADVRHELCNARVEYCDTADKYYALIHRLDGEFADRQKEAPLRSNGGS